jgi:hypothetical protein
MNETWKNVVGFEGYYQVSDQGRVKRIDSGRILKTAAGGRGYPIVQLSKEGKHKTTTVHRLVAIAFIGFPDNPLLTDVHHKNCDKIDARLLNLEWVTPKYNINNRANSLEDYVI